MRCFCAGRRVPQAEPAERVEGGENRPVRRQSVLLNDAPGADRAERLSGRAVGDVDAAGVLVNGGDDPTVRRTAGDQPVGAPAEIGQRLQLAGAELPAGDGAQLPERHARLPVRERVEPAAHERVVPHRPHFQVIGVPEVDVCPDRPVVQVAAVELGNRPGGEIDRDQFVGVALVAALDISPDERAAVRREPRSLEATELGLPQYLHPGSGVPDDQKARVTPAVTAGGSAPIDQSGCGRLNQPGSVGTQEDVGAVVDCSRVEQVAADLLAVGGELHEGASLLGRVLLLRIRDAGVHLPVRGHGLDAFVCRGAVDFPAGHRVERANLLVRLNEEVLRAGREPQPRVPGANLAFAP